jgi:hypothetical protein
MEDLDPDLQALITYAQAVDRFTAATLFNILIWFWWPW